MNITYLPLEPYKARYTEQLSVKDGWAETAFRRRFEKVISIRPDLPANTAIQTGKVLDRQQRPKWAMAQMSKIAELPYNDLGKIYCDDFFHPGLEALPYLGVEFQAYSFCWAQSWDIYDFTHKMSSWMRPYEIMALSIYSKVFVACHELKELMVSWSPDMREKVEVVGLPFDSVSVGAQRDPAYQCSEYDIVYASRFDTEKNPHFFLDLVEETGVKAAICTGHAELKGDATDAVFRAKKMEEDGRLDIHKGVTKGQYYAVLANSKIQFNCAFQDWVSFTLLEALTYGCQPLYPNFRAMPSTLKYAEENLYSPEDLESAIRKMNHLLGGRRHFPLKDEILSYHNGTLSRIAEIIHKD